MTHDDLKGWDDTVSPRVPRWLHISIDFSRTFTLAGSQNMWVYVNGRFVGSDSTTQSEFGIDLTGYSPNIWIADTWDNESPLVTRRVNFGHSETLGFGARDYTLAIGYFKGDAILGGAQLMHGAMRALVPSLPP